MKAAIWCILESISRGFPSLAGRKQSRCLQSDKKANKAKAFLRSSTNTHSFYSTLLIWLIIKKTFWPGFQFFFICALLVWLIINKKNFWHIHPWFQLKILHPACSILQLPSIKVFLYSSLAFFAKLRHNSQQGPPGLQDFYLLRNTDYECRFCSLSFIFGPFLTFDTSFLMFLAHFHKNSSGPIKDV